jgi:hypothetical protein
MSKDPPPRQVRQSTQGVCPKKYGPPDQNYKEKVIGLLFLAAILKEDELIGDLEV